MIDNVEQFDQGERRKKRFELGFHTLAVSLVPICHTQSKLLLFVTWAKDETVRSINVINPCTTKSKNWAAHTFDRSITSENDEIAPR